MKNIANKLYLLLLIFILTGCDKTPIKITVNSSSISNRFSIESFGTFEAGYQSNKREILEITDTKTGQKYIGITGVGITEEHSGMAGKVIVTNEE